MQAEARVAIIGGGVVGCSILFHLAKLEACRSRITRLRPPLPLRERVGVRGSFHLADCRPSRTNPSSGASRHLLPQGEKG